ncbi:L-histidine N(alpha)-methyltransferase [Methyloradius palustris]|uniref:Dimethylhistidine N-methyltransferase n=1 Tax=Methyloradius palustris TaxID=2778876 RepID=A0A8D5G5K8_9PROT|nr:L-histidine N(alpha)-methyltransferase [Methyloradius palustris]BCM23751.1 dimethylhistidine N-methyltransferase [Methyloradius palustris]
MNKMTEIPQITNQAFLQDVLDGLSQKQKTLPCKWFYDETGSQLFEAITKTREYYPTRVETRLLQQAALELTSLIPELQVLIEPGSGASVKTRALLQTQAQLKHYIPIDISAEFLQAVAAQLQADFPQINTVPVVGDFSMDMPTIDWHGIAKTGDCVVFFPGSTIGNFSPEEASKLLSDFHQLAGEHAISKKKWLLIGVDSTQNTAQLVNAYNDAAGITAAFNKNLLVRANQELQANFELDQFKHEARFNPVESRIEMHLVSLQKQVVEIAGSSFVFESGESILTENCYKYAQPRFLEMAQKSGWQSVKTWQDQQESEFCLFLFRASAP